MNRKVFGESMVAQTINTTADDEAAVRTLYLQLMEGWNQGSGEAFAAPFAENGDLVAFDGLHFEGRREIISFQQPLFDKWLKGTRLVGQVKSVRFLTPDVALMHVIGGTILRGESRPSPVRDSIQTLVAVRKNGEWKLAAFQNTRLRPMSRSFASTLLWMLTDWLWKLILRESPEADASRPNLI
jgi:uncharacterized protein (TIGR02246 family)